MLDENEKGFGGHGPDIEIIQCKDCKYQGSFVFDGKLYKGPGGPKCKMYADKPDGIIFPIRKFLDDKGEYINCPKYERE